MHHPDHARSWGVATALLATVILWIGSAPVLAQGANPFQGFSARVTGDIYSQVKVIQDVDGDGKKDLVFGATDGQIHLYSSRGKEIFAGLWPKHTGGPVLADVGVADLDHDGREEIVCGSYDGKVYGLNLWGKELWAYDTRGTVQMSGPEITDLDGSGDLHIFAGSQAGTVVHLDGTGRAVWEAGMRGKVSARVVASDLNGDGIKEIVAKDDSGQVAVFDQRGIRMNGWPRDTAESGYWPFEVGVTDLNGDGQKDVFTTSPNKKLQIWDRTGKEQYAVPLSDGAHSAPRVVDLNGDGQVEFVITQADGTVNVVSKDGKPLPGWPYRCKDSFYGPPQIFDIDGDGKLDIVFTGWNPNGEGKQAGYVMVLNREGKPVPGYPLYVGKTIAPVTVADLNGDGWLEMVIAGGINFTDEQLHVVPLKAKVPLHMATIATEVTF